MAKLQGAWPQSAFEELHCQQYGSLGSGFSYNSHSCSSLPTLVSFLLVPQHAKGMDNRQTRMLAGAHLSNQTTENMFPVALENLRKRIDLAIVLDHFDLGIGLLSRMFDRPSPPVYDVIKEKSESGPLPTDIPSWVLDYVKKVNVFDAALYAHATRQLLAWGTKAGLIIPPPQQQHATTSTSNSLSPTALYECAGDISTGYNPKNGHYIAKRCTLLPKHNSMPSRTYSDDDTTGR